MTFHPKRPFKLIRQVLERLVEKESASFPFPEQLSDARKPNAKTGMFGGNCRRSSGRRLKAGGQSDKTQGMRFRDIESKSFSPLGDKLGVSFSGFRG